MSSTYTETPVLTLLNDTGKLYMEKVTRGEAVKWRVCVTCSTDVRSHIPMDGKGFMEFDNSALAAIINHLKDEVCDAV